MSNMVTDKKVITCLDGKERLFYKTEQGEIKYTQWKGGKAWGTTNQINPNKYPKFITKEMIIF